MTDARIMRATLGFLFEPADRRLADLLASHGLTDTYNLVTRGTTSFTPRAELGGLTTARMADAADAAVTYASAGGGRIVIPDDEDWPVGLDDARDWAPICLWVAGPGIIPQPQSAVTVVGARACTAYGEDVASDLAAGLSDNGQTVVSTNGFGVDRAALRAAAAVEGHPVAVVPCGLDQLRPDDHVAQQLADNGLLISGFPPGTRYNRSRADLNRLFLAVLTGGTVVVESPLRGSALTVAVTAAQHGRAAMTVPGPVTSLMSHGCHRLLRDHPEVRPVTGVDDVLADLRSAFVPVWPRTRSEAGDDRTA